ncbi:hypothetical protein PHYPO_G00018170 [Pangasianodon hypophthalmus]|uniref:Uncharacterized protein n=1 Tax=Pangasianodon hypophthalmus TaxID=310915 RepID=A0A5N5N6Q7_PANHP|nr:hypothetical protein PHYPO_G00018170 [Pangasianodon hypophthalmus]
MFDDEHRGTLWSASERLGQCPRLHHIPERYPRCSRDAQSHVITVSRLLVWTVTVSYELKRIRNRKREELPEQLEVQKSNASGNAQEALSAPGLKKRKKRRAPRAA